MGHGVRCQSAVSHGVFAEGVRNSRRPGYAGRATCALSLPVQPRTLVVERAGFRFDPGQTVLHGVSARIRPGEMVAFIGPSGTGKSTLLNLLMRFYDPSEGALRLDGVDYRDLRISDLRRHMALVGQDTPILPLSVAENIAYGRPGATREDIVNAARMADAVEFIAGLPMGYDTVLAEGGQNLSGGQRQRIAIARALLSRAPFLILDEPTSALDPDHELRLISTLLDLRATGRLSLSRTGSFQPCIATGSLRWRAGVLWSKDRIAS